MLKYLHFNCNRHGPEGEIVSTNLSSYKIPTIADIPQVKNCVLYKVVCSIRVSIFVYFCKSVGCNRFQEPDIQIFVFNFATPTFSIWHSILFLSEGLCINHVFFNVLFLFLFQEMNVTLLRNSRDHREAVYSAKVTFLFSQKYVIQICGISTSILCISWLFSFVQQTQPMLH